MKFIFTIKKIFINLPYLMLYPISDKPETEQKALVDAINSCDMDNDNNTALLLNSLYEYAQEKVRSLKADKKSIVRNLNYSYKTKRTKKHNKETGEKEIVTFTVEKDGSKNIIKRFQHLKEENENETKSYEDLIKAIESRNITINQLILFDALLKENKYKELVYIVLLFVAILIPILVFMLSKTLNI